MMARVKRFLTGSILSLALRYLLGALILLSAFPRLLDIERYSVYVVYSYYILPVQPVNVARFFGLVIPYIELCIGLGFIFGVMTRLSAIAWMVISLLYFAVKLHLIFIQNRIVPCGCFPAVIPGMLVTESIWLDFISALFCIQILLVKSERQLLSLRSLLPEKWRKGCLKYVW